MFRILKYSALIASVAVAFGSITQAQSESRGINFKPKVAFTAQTSVDYRTSGDMNDLSVCLEPDPNPDPDAPSNFEDWLAGYDPYPIPGIFPTLREAHVRFNLDSNCQSFGEMPDLYVNYPIRSGTIDLSARFSNLPAGWRICRDIDLAFNSAQSLNSYSSQQGTLAQPFEMTSNFTGGSGGGGGDGVTNIEWAVGDIFLGTSSYIPPFAASPKDSFIANINVYFCGPDPLTQSGQGWRYSEFVYTSPPFGTWK